MAKQYAVATFRLLVEVDVEASSDEDTHRANEEAALEAFVSGFAESYECIDGLVDLIMTGAEWTGTTDPDELENILTEA